MASEPDQHSVMSASQAFVQIALDIAREVNRWLAEAMQDDDPRGPHQARVSLRKLRSAVRAFEPILDRRFASDLRHEARYLFRQLGKVRDADILLEAATDASRTARKAHADEMRARVRRKLDRAGAEDFTERLAAQLDRKRWRRTGARAKELRKAPVNGIALAALNDTWQGLQRSEPLAAMADATLHTLRKRLKALRYQTEFFGPLLGYADWKAALDIMKELQDQLGVLTDIALAAGPDDARHKPLAQASTLLNRLDLLGPWWIEDDDAVD
jgi:CHAD domain-containing protein